MCVCVCRLFAVLGRAHLIVPQHRPCAPGSCWRARHTRAPRPAPPAGGRQRPAPHASAVLQSPGCTAPAPEPALPVPPQPARPASAPGGWARVPGRGSPAPVACQPLSLPRGRHQWRLLLPSPLPGGGRPQGGWAQLQIEAVACASGARVAAEGGRRTSPPAPGPCRTLPQVCGQPLHKLSHVLYLAESYALFG